MRETEKRALDMAFDRFELLCQEATTAIDAFHKLDLNRMDDAEAEIKEMLLLRSLLRRWLARLEEEEGEL